ncbi:type II secretion system protein [Roseateles sp. LYH14W]|uniref:Type II secretion system protein n=1 Tax=Pelomonas parva TaxID=3299032 RepID=A0ABW7F8H5_9BURK
MPLRFLHQAMQVEADRLAHPTAGAGLTQRGFTLFELVLTLLIVGMLAAVALPRFLQVSDEARVASLNSLAAAVRTAATAWRMKCAARSAAGCPMSVGVFNLNAGTQSIQMWNGWPDAGDSIGSNGIDIAVNARGFDVSISVGQITAWRMGSAPDPANCSVQYREAVSAGTEPTITVKTSGC